MVDSNGFPAGLIASVDRDGNASYPIIASVDRDANARQASADHSSVHLTGKLWQGFGYNHSNAEADSVVAQKRLPRLILHRGKEEDGRSEICCAGASQHHP
eukprot:2222754-Rhodomonas_salina.4